MAKNGEEKNDQLEQNISDEEDDADTSSDEDNSVDDDTLYVQEIKEKQMKVDEDPYVYDHQAGLLSILRTAGELEHLRNARNNMNRIFPLSPELWLQWIEDEKKIANTEEERNEVIELFKRATEEYNSPEVWLEYVQFSIGDMERKGTNYVREVFEKAITAVGLHVTKATFIWQAYAEFEGAILAGLQPQPGAVSTPQQNELQASQLKKILSIFKRQLSQPLIGIDNTLEEYKSFVEEVDPLMLSSYEKAKDKLKILMPFEEALERAAAPKTNEYKTYIKHVYKSGDPARIQSIFERALVENCLVPDFWLKYGKYLDKELRSRTAILKMYQRAVRNCPWSSDIWLLHLLALERFRYNEHEVITGEFVKILRSNQLTSAPDYFKIWQGYCDYMRRRIDWDQDDHSEKVEDLRKTFQQAVDNLTEYYGKEGDPTCSLLQYQARIEAKFCKNMEKARECWNTIMQQGFGNQAQMWLEYFNLERSYGNHKHCRKILQRALNSVTDWPEYVVDTFLTFEREEGSLEQYEQAMEKCEAQMVRLEERKAKEKAEMEKKFEKDKEMLKWSRMSRKRKLNLYCNCCKTKGHERLSFLCDSLVDPPLTNITPFKGKFDVLSNFYPCKVKVWEGKFESTEHAYQYKKAVENNCRNIAKNILSLKEARDVKIESHKIQADERWFKMKLDLFKELLQAKALYCIDYVHGLLNAKEVIAEAVPDDNYWSTGLSKEEVIYCKQENWPGENQMGKLHMYMRQKLLDNVKKLHDNRNVGLSCIPQLRTLCLKVTGPVEASHICYCKAAEKESFMEEKKKSKQHHEHKTKGKPQRQSHKMEKFKQEPSERKIFVKSVEDKESPMEFENNTDESTAKKDSMAMPPPPPGFKAPVAPPPGFKNKKPPPGYQHTDEPPSKKLKVEESKETSPVKPGDKESTSKCTVFVSNIDYRIKESDLTPIFMKCGELKDIRLIKGPQGKSKGFGYVEFKEEGPVRSALGLDRTPINGRPMFVSESKDNKLDKEAKFKYAVEMEKTKLFVRNLPHSVTKEAVEQIFSEHGKVKDVRLVTYRNGVFKGLAYVEYEDEETTSKAVMKTDGLKVGECEISVAISNPPPRKGSGKDDATQYKPSLGGGKKEADRGGRAKTMLAFQPRSLQSRNVQPTQSKKAPSSTTDKQHNSDSDSSNKKAGLSNAEFRSMLLKK